MFRVGQWVFGSTQIQVSFGAVTAIISDTKAIIIKKKTTSSLFVKKISAARLHGRLLEVGNIREENLRRRALHFRPYCFRLM